MNICIIYIAFLFWTMETLSPWNDINKNHDSEVSEMWCGCVITDMFRQFLSFYEHHLCVWSQVFKGCWEFNRSDHVSTLFTCSPHQTSRPSNKNGIHKPSKYFSACVFPWKLFCPFGPLCWDFRLAGKQVCKC